MSLQTYVVMNGGRTITLTEETPVAAGMLIDDAAFDDIVTFLEDNGWIEDPEFNDNKKFVTRPQEPLL